MEPKRSRLSWNARCTLCLVPSLVGTAVFFAVPFVRMVYYSFIESQFHRIFVGLRNYQIVWENTYFQLALRNSLLLIGIGVPLLLLLALGISLYLAQDRGRRGLLWTVFVLPMLIPTAGIILIWQRLFEWSITALPVYLLFLWKNTGICVILLSASLTALPAEMFEAARLDGAGSWQIHIQITIPSILPAVIFAVLLSVVNSFRIFKESYLFYGTDYPPNHSYTLQYYMNNHFTKLNYQSLACGAVMTFLLVMVFVTAGLRLQKKYEW